MTQAIETAKQPSKADKVAALLNSPQLKNQLAAALPKHMTPDRMARIVLTEVRKNPELAECDQMSFLGAIIQAAQLGLEPGSGLGHAYLIPFRNRSKNIKEVQMIPGYRGLIDLARRSAEISSLSAHCVYRGDEFDFEYGLNERLSHKPKGETDPDKIVFVYAVAKFKDGGHQFEVMTRSQVDAVRDGLKYPNPVWRDHYAEMARKTAVRRLAKYLPQSPELRRATELEAMVDEEKGQENWAVLDATYTPVPPAHDPEKANAIRNAPDDSPDAKAAKEATMQVALNALDQEASYVLDSGGDPQTIVGLTREQLIAQGAPTILAAAQKLREWSPEP